MSSLDSGQRGLRLAVRNVGGIDRTEVELPPGVTVLAGRNATNRTSLLRALMGAMGSDDVSLKGDAEEGRVELTLGDETYTRTLERSDDGVVLGGDPYLDDATAADLFAFLLENNRARVAVASDQDLADVVMRPVDTDELEAEIRSLEERKRELDREIEELEALEGRLPELEDERARLTDEIADTEEELAALEDDIEARSADPDEKREEQSAFEEKMAELRSARNDLEELRYDVESQERSLEALREDREQLLADREDYPAGDADVEEIEAKVEQRRRRKSQIETELNELQSVIQFNEELLEERDAELQAAVGDEDDGELTDQLLESDTTVCWTCGSEVATDQIADTIDRLRELRQEKRERQRDIDAEIDDLETERMQHEERRRQREQIERELREVERELERREDRLADLRERRSAAVERVDELEAAVDDLDDAAGSELLELHREANDLEFELGRLRNDLDGVEDEIATVEERLEERPSLRERRAEVDAELSECRSRIRTLEEGAVEAFNDHMSALLALLDYDNLERIWLERVGQGGTGDATFRLHVVRSTDDGVTYEDSVGHLSESEREVTGLVFALAGYLVHDLGEEVPLVVLDSLEAIDAQRIAGLVDYFADHTDYLVVALLREDAAALPERHERITDI